MLNPNLLCSSGGLPNSFYQSANVLYKNNGDGTFTDVTARSGIATSTGSVTFGASLGDYNRDGYLDIFFPATGQSPATGAPRYDPNKLYRNDGDFSFFDVSVEAGVTGLLDAPDPQGDLHPGGCVVQFTDYNMDRWPDILIGNCIGAEDVMSLYRNNGDGTFTNVYVEAGLNEPLGVWMGMALGDFDNDGDIVRKGKGCG